MSRAPPPLLPLKKEQVFTQYHETVIERISSGVFFNIMWPVVIWGLLIGKLVNGGTHDFIKHFTNWNWSMNAIFFTTRTIGRLPWILTGRTTHNRISLFANGCLFWLTNGMSWLVFWLVLIMLADNPDILLEMAKEFGLGMILDLDRVFHVFPTVFLLIYWAMCGHEISWPLQVLVYRGSFDGWRKITWVYFIFNVLFGGLLIMAIYFACFDISAVYGITTSSTFIVFLSISISLVLNGLTFVNLRRKYVV